MLAALSFSAADSGRRYSERSADYTKMYYAADMNAKKKLAEIDSVVSAYNDYSDFMLLSELDETDGIEYESIFGGIEISWFTEINERQNIYARVKYSNAGFEILNWQTVSAGEIAESPLNVWSGEN